VSSRPTPAESLASAARQLNYALDDSATTDLAFQKLYAAGDPRQQPMFHQLEDLLRSPQSDETVAKSLRLSSFPTLAWLLRQTAAPERAAAAVFSEYSRYQSFSAASLAVVWSEFTDFLVYLAAVLAILIVVVSVYGIFVLPQFESLYRGFDINVPTLTSVLFGHGFPVFGLLLLVAAAVLGSVAWFVIQLRRQLRRYSPLPSAYGKVPLLGRVAKAYGEYLWLSYTGLLRTAGMPAEQALRVAASRLELPHAGQGEIPAAPGLLSDLSTSARLGKLDAETQFQQEATADGFLNELARCRRRVRFVLTLIVYGIVAMFVSGMYLPIFSLGSAF